MLRILKEWEGFVGAPARPGPLPRRGEGLIYMDEWDGGDVLLVVSCPGSLRPGHPPAVLLRSPASPLRCAKGDCAVVDSCLRRNDGRVGGSVAPPRPGHPPAVLLRSPASPLRCAKGDCMWLWIPACAGMACGAKGDCMWCVLGWVHFLVSPSERGLI